MPGVQKLFEGGEKIIIECYDLCAKVEDLKLDDFWQNFYVKEFVPPRKSALQKHSRSKKIVTKYKSSWVSI